MVILLIFVGIFIIFNLLFVFGCFRTSSKESRQEEKEIEEKINQKEKDNI